MSKTEWERAKGPNYKTNVDLKYPYSELPFITEYHLVKLPPSGQLIDLVDYWGEGRIVTKDGVTGFPDCYNVNRQYQLVSNGDDRDRRIPNRIPVVDENNCDTSRYIENGSVKTVTVMNAPFNKAAKDITRMINSANGKVVYFFNIASDDIRSLAHELKQKGIFHCHGYSLPGSLKGLTMFSGHHAFLNTTEINEELYSSITSGDYSKAVEIFKTLDENGGGNVATNVVSKMLDQGLKNTSTLVYHLWQKGARGIVTKYFPKEYEMIFNYHSVKITSKHFGLSLKLNSNTNENARSAWGDGSDKSIHRLKWKIIPELMDSTCVFKILNEDYNLCLMLDATPDSDYGDRRAWGSALTGEVRFRWTLDPVKVYDQIVFLIENRHYHQGLKLDSNTDGTYGDRGLWGHNGRVADAPGYYGFLIEEAH